VSPKHSNCVCMHRSCDQYRLQKLPILNRLVFTVCVALFLIVIFAMLQEESCGSSFAERRLGSVLLMPRSLIIVKSDMYNKYLHGIHETTSDTVDDKYANIDACPGVSIGDTFHRTKPRISLTVRVVPKVLKNKILFGKH